MSNDTRPKSEAKQLVAKKLRTGEIAIWDDTEKSVVLVSFPGGEGHAVARVLRGQTLKALDEALGDVVVLV